MSRNPIPYSPLFSLFLGHFPLTPLVLSEIQESHRVEVSRLMQPSTFSFHQSLSTILPQTPHHFLSKMTNPSETNVDAATKKTDVAPSTDVKGPTPVSDNAKVEPAKKAGDCCGGCDAPKN